MNDHATSFLFGVEQSVSGASWIAPKKAKENLKDLFKQEFDLTEAMSELLVNRNFNIEELSNFFDPKIKNLMPDPLVLKDMDKTIDRLLTAVLDKETIGIFGGVGSCNCSFRRGLVALFETAHLHSKDDLKLRGAPGIPFMML